MSYDSAMSEMVKLWHKSNGNIVKIETVKTKKSFFYFSESMSVYKLYKQSQTNSVFRYFE